MTAHLQSSPLAGEHVPHVHDEVVSLMNEPVGRVVAVFDDFFKLSIGEGLFYAPFQCIFKRTSNRITLICDQSGVSRYLFDNR